MPNLLSSLTSRPVAACRDLFPLASTPIDRRSARPLCCLLALGVLGALLTGCDGSSSTGTTNTNNMTGTTVAGRGTISATFSNPAGTNANTEAFQSTMGQVLTNSNASGLTLLNVMGTTAAGSTARTLTISLAENGPIQVGKAYTFGGSSASTLTYTQAGLTGAQGWIASGGSATVDSITGKNYKLHVSAATFTTDVDNASGATGSFTINGTADVTLP